MIHKTARMPYTKTGYSRPYACCDGMGNSLNFSLQNFLQIIPSTAEGQHLLPLAQGELWVTQNCRMFQDWQWNPLALWASKENSHTEPSDFCTTPKNPNPSNNTDPKSQLETLPTWVFHSRQSNHVYRVCYLAWRNPSHIGMFPCHCYLQLQHAIHTWHWANIGGQFLAPTKKFTI